MSIVPAAPEVSITLLWCACMHVCGHVPMAQMWRPEGSLQGLALSLYHMGPKPKS